MVQILLLLSCSEHNIVNKCSSNFKEIETICLVENVDKLTSFSDIISVCNSLDGIWKDECFFRSAEALSKSGNLKEAFSACDLSGEYNGECASHVIWQWPGPNLTSASLTTILEADLENTLSSLENVELPKAVNPKDQLTARWWQKLYLGSGKACPIDNPYARSGYAVESVRLGIPINTILNNKKCITGPKKHNIELANHHHGPSPDQKRIQVGPEDWRLVDDDPKQDLLIATLVGIFGFKGPSSMLDVYVIHENPNVSETAKMLISKRGKHESIRYKANTK